mgnify:CR=1 FL=1
MIFYLEVYINNEMKNKFNTNDFLNENIKSWFDVLRNPKLKFDSDLNKNQVNKTLQKKVNNMRQSSLSSSIIASDLEGDLGNKLYLI